MIYTIIFIFALVHILSYIDNDEYFYKNAHIEYMFYTGAFFLISFKLYPHFDNKILLNIILFMGIILFWFLYVDKRFFIQGGKIVAKQTNMWGISPKDIIKQTKNSIHQKKGRREFEVPTRESIANDYFIDIDLRGNKKIHQNFLLLHLKEYNHFTIHHDDVEEFFKKTKHKLYKVLFEKIKFFIESSEDDIDLNKILEENGFCIEFFLINLWERYANIYSYGIGTLQIYTYNNDGNKDSNLEALLYAVDAAVTTNIHRKGFSLYFYYYHFKKNKERGI